MGLRSMRRFALVSHLLAAVACAPDDDLDDDETSADAEDEALRRGVVADDEHPEVGMLTTENGYCTGTLIGPRTVLTAAHCFDFGSGIVAASQPPYGKFIVRKPDGTRVAYGYHRYRADANVLQVGFDIGIAQLDLPVPADVATPASIGEAWPDSDETLTVYGYGRFDKKCKSAGDNHKRKELVELPWGFSRRITCPGDSGGPYFVTGTSSIVAVVKGDGLGVEWVGDAVDHRAWIMKHREASERGNLFSED